MTLLRRNPRRDENEPLLVEYLRKAGCVVQRLSGPDIPDLLVGYRGRWLLLEVKMPGADLKPGQELFHNSCQALGLPCGIIRTVEDCQAVLKRVRRAA